MPDRDFYSVLIVLHTKPSNHQAAQRIGYLQTKVSSNQAHRQNEPRIRSARSDSTASESRRACLMLMHGQGR